MLTFSKGSEIFWPNGRQAEFFSSEDYFPGAARKALPTAHATRVSLPNNGEVVIKPRERMAYVKLADEPDYFQSRLSDFVVEPLGRHEAFQPAAYDRSLSIRDLLWTAGFHSSQGRLDTHDDSGDSEDKFGIVKMSQWPNLTRVPHSVNTMRICALLTRFPTAVALIPRLLEIDGEEVCRVLSAARNAGILLGGSAVQAFHDAPGHGSEREEDEGFGRTYNLVRSLFNKIHRL